MWHTTIMARDIDKVEVKSNIAAIEDPQKYSCNNIRISYMRFTHRDFAIYLNQIFLSCLFLPAYIRKAG